MSNRKSSREKPRVIINNDMKRSALQEPLLINNGYETKIDLEINPGPLSKMEISGSRDRRPTELIVPDVVKNIRSRSKNTLEDGANTFNTISLSRDIFMTIVVLKAYHIWSDIPIRHRRQLLILAVICICLQFGLLCTLLIEMILEPPWKERDIDYGVGDGIRDGKSFLVIITKFWCLVSVLIYLFKELYELKAYRKLRREIQDFRTTCSKLLFSIYTLYNLSLYIMAMALSVVLISTSFDGFDAVLNAVAILFVLEIDNWIFSMIKANPFIEDELFDIRYEKHKEMTSYLIAKYKWISSVCSCFCGDSYELKAEGNETFISLISLFVWFSMIISMSLMCLGWVYNENILLRIGTIMLSVVGAYYIFRNGFNVIGGLVFKLKNRSKINDFVTVELPRICHKYVKKIDAQKKSNTSSINKIKEEFVEECDEYFGRNSCGVKETDFTLKEKLLTAFDEYYMKCDKSRIQTNDVDFGAVVLGIKFRT